MSRVCTNITSTWSRRCFVNLKCEKHGMYYSSQYSTASAGQSHIKPGRAHTGNPRNIVLIDGVRLPFLKYVTDYKKLSLYELSVAVLRGLQQRTGISKKGVVDCVVFGSIYQNVSTANIAREALLGAGFDKSIPGYTVMQACISSNQALSSAIGQISLGNADVAIAGGAEFISDPPIRYHRQIRQGLVDFMMGPNSTGQKLGIAFNKLLSSKILQVDFPPPVEYHTGEVFGHFADRLASAFAITRTEQDEFAARSHNTAYKAHEDGFLSDIIPYQVPGTDKVVTRDNGPRVSSTEKLGKLKPSFVKPHGSVTPGNASFLADGASACLVMTEDKALELGLKPKAYIRNHTFACGDVKDEVLLGPSYAIAKLLGRSNLTLADFDVFEIHEAFAAVVLGIMRTMESDYFCTKQLNLQGKLGSIPMEKVNTWGGSLSIGHPFGATGVRLVTTAANRLIEEDGHLALVTACAAGAHGTAMVLERYPN